MAIFSYFLNQPMKGLRESLMQKSPLTTIVIHCHSERSEESRIFRGLRSFTPFRMTEKRLLQEAQEIQTPGAGCNSPGRIRRHEQV
jgi:hypothetical protein